MVISFNSIKGGVGKSTLAVNFAAWLVKEGHDVLLVDGDEQETSSDFTAYREQTKGDTGYTLVNMTGANLRKQVESMRSKYDHIVIDTGGRDTTSQRAALSVADVAMISLTPHAHIIYNLESILHQNLHLFPHLNVIRKRSKNTMIVNLYSYFYHTKKLY